MITNVAVAVGFGVTVLLGPPPSPPDSSEYSIAVLPFDNLIDSTEDEYLGDGLAEELLNLLAQTEDLDVTARKASFYFNVQDKAATLSLFDTRSVNDNRTVDCTLTGCEFEGKNTARFIIGFSAQILLLNLNLDYNIAATNSVTLGLMFGF